MKNLSAIVLVCTLLMSIAVAGCKTTAPTVKTLAEYKGRKLDYGSQGGFTGGGTTVSILENGQVFSTNLLTNDESYHGQIPTKDAKALIDEAEALLKKHTGLSGTGNMTYHLVYHNGTTPNRITWASEMFPADDIKLFVQKVSQTIEKAK